MDKNPKKEKTYITSDIHWSGQPDVLYMSKGNFEAYMKIMNPTHGMNKKEKKLYKLLYEN